MKKIQTDREQPDILIIMSDQHSAQCCGFMGDRIAHTPNLDRLAAQGVIFQNAYTSCPLCVPARASFMTGKMPSKLSVFSNNDSLPSDQPTFAHIAAIEGYQTILCGRMHFVGPDQRHGFAERPIGDLCHWAWGNWPERLQTLTPFGKPMAAMHCLKLYGAGDSPVLDYDKAVCDAAIERLSQTDDIAIIRKQYSCYLGFAMASPAGRVYS